MQTWLSVQITAPAAQEELISWLMLQGGSNGCQLNSNNGITTIEATFKPELLSEAALQVLKTSLKDHGLEQCLDSLRIETIPEQDWLMEWKKGFEPFTVGEQLLICPVWLKDQIAPAPDQKVILIDPGMAFGTGLHTTTRYCLRQITKLKSPKDILDVGTGSGILSIAAALCLPEANITAIDICEHSIENAHYNLDLNHVANRIDLLLGTTDLLKSLTVDCILSNITCEDIISLLLEYLRLLRPSGIVICAGILKEKLPLLEHAIASYPLSITHQEDEGEWVGLILSRIPVVFKM